MGPLYTKVFIQFTSGFKKEDLANIEIVNKIHDSSLQIINTFLDIYKYVTKEDYVERLGELSINNIYFSKYNRGFSILYPGGIGSAAMNCSKNDLDKIEKILLDGVEPPLYELLLLNARSSLAKNALTLAVVQSFQALEVYIDRYLFNEYSVNGLLESDIIYLLNKKWLTKDRLSSVLKDVTGYRLSEERLLWDKWCTLYDNIRNEVIHKGRETSKEEAGRVIGTNESVIDWIKQIKNKKPTLTLAKKILNKKHFNFFKYCKKNVLKFKNKLFLVIKKSRLK
jgi:hypothetical protein